MRERLVWIAQVLSNAPQGWMPEGNQWQLLEEAYQKGYDPWETASALIVGTWPPYSGKGAERYTWKRRFLA